MGTGDGVGFFKHNDQKHQATQLERPQKQREAPMAWILPPIPPLFRSLCPPPPLWGFIGDGLGSARLDVQHNSPHIFQNTLPVYHSISYLPHENCRRGGENFRTANQI